MFCDEHCVLCHAVAGSNLFVFYGGKEFATSNEIMITFIIEQMPIGIIGIIIAGIFAAAMSSIDSLLNSMTAVFTKDIYEPCVKKGSVIESDYDYYRMYRCNYDNCYFCSI